MSIIKQIFPAIVVVVACILLSGFPSLYVLMTTNSMVGIQGTVKGVMSSGIYLFLLLLGVIGAYFMTRTDYKHFDKLVIIGEMFVCTSVLGTMILFNYAYS